MVCLAQKEEAHKATNNCLTVITAVIMPPGGDVSSHATIRRQLFVTENPASSKEKKITSRNIDNLLILMQDINLNIHQMMSSATEIKSIFAATLKTPFTKKITKVKICQTDKLRILSYSGKMDSTDHYTGHITAFNIAI
ncbi:hypothetical protein Bca4012_019860 [Brassica carinata]